MKTFRHYRFLESIAALIFVSFISNCSNDVKSDAYGQFEATEITISSQAAGELLKFTVDEGDQLKTGVTVGWVDTTQFALKRQQLETKIISIKANITQIKAQIDVQKEQLALAQSNLSRIKGMYKDDAATAQQLDDAQARVKVIKEKIEVLKSNIQAVKTSIKSVNAQIDQVEERIKDAKIINPVNGTVLTSFVEPYEIVRQGQPLYHIANLDTLILQVYASGAQLPHIKLGAEVQVIVDKNAEQNQTLQGTVTWIANKAEFTPQQVQTKEERVTQVYAIEVRVPNSNGILKIGMPGEVNF